MENEAALQKERLNIEESREKRLARIKRKQRNRGGIFKPKEHNPLLDILMSRDVSGRSPTKVRSRSRPPSSDHEVLDNVVHPRKSTSTRATDRRKSNAANASASVAGKGRKQSIGSSIKASIVQDSSTKNIPFEKKPKSATTSRNASKRSENSETQEISLPSKRPREDGDEQNIHIDLPSPPKRAKKNNASTAASSTTRLKPARANRKTPAKSKPESKTKGKTRATSADQESQEDGARPSKPKKAAVSKKNKKTNVEGCVEDRPSAPKPKSARTAAGGDESGTKPKTKRTTTRGPRKKRASDDEDGAGPKSNHEKAKRRGKQKTTAESEHETEPEEESHYRPKIAKPRLETVVEEDEEDPDLEIGIKDGIKEPLSSSRTHRGASTLQPNVLFQKEGQRRKRTAEDNVESNTLQETKVPVAKKSKVAVKNSGPRAKVSSMTVEEDAREVEGKPPPNTRRKAKNSIKSSESGDNPEHSHPHPSTPPSTSRRNNSDSKKGAKSAVTGPATRSKTTSTTKSKSRSKLTTKSTLKRAAPAQFANQPALLTSPIKETDNGADELDFLS